MEGSGSGGLFRLSTRLLCEERARACLLGEGRRKDRLKTECRERGGQRSIGKRTRARGRDELTIDISETRHQLRPSFPFVDLVPQHVVRRRDECYLLPETDQKGICDVKKQTTVNFDFSALAARPPHHASDSLFSSRIACCSSTMSFLRARNAAAPRTPKTSEGTGLSTREASVRIRRGVSKQHSLDRLTAFLLSLLAFSTASDAVETRCCLASCPSSVPVDG